MKGVCKKYLSRNQYMSDLINILSIIDDKSQLINFPKLDPNSFKPAVLTDSTLERHSKGG